MANFYEQKRDGLTAKLLSKYGVPMTLKVTTGELFNELTGEATGGTYKAHALQAMVLSKKRSEKGGDSSVSQGDLSIFAGASKLAVTPTTSDRIVHMGVEYEVVEVKPVSPAGIAVAYEIRMRVP